MLNAMFIVQAKTGWLTGKKCQLFDNLAQKYNPYSKLSRVQVIKKGNEVKSKKGEGALKVKYQDQAKLMENNSVVVHHFLMCMKL